MNQISFSHPSLIWEGRTHCSRLSVTAAFPGVGNRFHFIGNKLIANIFSSSFDCWIRIGINGDFTRKIQLRQGPNLIQVISQDFEGEIAFFRCSESWQGIVQFDSLEFEGSIEKSMLSKQEKLLFVGDSITCGSATLLEGDALMNQSVTNDAYFSFGMVLARRRNAEAHLVSYGGRGLYRDWQGFTSDKMNNAPEFFERSLPDREDLKWNHSNFEPHKVLVALGQNDFNQGIVDSKIWVPAYEKFIRRIKAVHPSTHVSITNSPMQSEGETRATLIELLKTVCVITQSQYIELPFLPGAKDAHPDSRGHEMIAQIIQNSWS
jgi:hypothetical protein